MGITLLPPAAAGLGLLLLVELVGIVCFLPLLALLALLILRGWLAEWVLPVWLALALGVAVLLRHADLLFELRRQYADESMQAKALPALTASAVLEQPYVADAAYSAIGFEVPNPLD